MRRLAARNRKKTARGALLCFFGLLAAVSAMLCLLQRAAGAVEAAVCVFQASDADAAAGETGPRASPAPPAAADEADGKSDAAGTGSPEPSADALSPSPSPSPPPSPSPDVFPQTSVRPGARSGVQIETVISDGQLENLKKTVNYINNSASISANYKISSVLLLVTGLKPEYAAALEAQKKLAAQAERFNAAAAGTDASQITGEAAGRYSSPSSALYRTSELLRDNLLDLTAAMKKRDVDETGVQLGRAACNLNAFSDAVGALADLLESVGGTG